MVQVLTEGRHAAEFILSEAQGMRSRGAALAIDPQSFSAGQILRKVAATTDVAEHYVPITTNAQGDAIAIYNVTTSSGENVSFAIIERDCEVNGNLLTYFSGASAGDKTAVNAVLKALGIIVR